MTLTTLKIPHAESFFGIIYRMSENLRDNFVRYLTYIMLALILIGGIVKIYPDYRRSQSLKRQNAELQEEIDRRKRAIAKLVENQRRFKTDSDFVEKIARQNQRVFPGELVFIFEKD